MKHLIVLALLVAGVHMIQICNLDKIEKKCSLVYCDTENIGEINYTENFHSEGIPGAIQEKTINYSVPPNLKQYLISCVLAIDQKEKDPSYAAEVKIVGGGLHYKTISLKIKTEIDKGFDYNVTVRIFKNN